MFGVPPRQPTLAGCFWNTTVWMPLGWRLVVVNMTVRRTPLSVTAIWGFSSRVWILHRSHSSMVTEPRYFSVDTNT